VAQTVNTTTTFTPADSTTRGGASPFMDVGGVWNGTSEVTATTGDTFNLTVSVSGSTASNVVTTVGLPTGFSYVAGSASGAPTGVTGSQVGQILSFSYSTPVAANTNILAGGSRSINYGLRVGNTVVSGTYQLSITNVYRNTAGSFVTNTTQQNILVQTGASVISKSPGNQVSTVGSVVSWTVQIDNTGLGGLFDVALDEAAINPGTSLTLQSITQTAPATPTATVSAGKLTLPYLKPGQSFKATVTALVTSCDSINNTVTTTDRTGASAKNTSAQITLNLQSPLVALQPGNFALPYSGTVPVSLNITNTGLGGAYNFVLESSLESLGVALTGLAAGWSYNASNGQFTRTAAGGLLTNNQIVTLSFNLASTNVCSGAGGGTVVWTSIYTDQCGNPYNTPTVFSSISPPANAPSVNISKTSSIQRLVVGQAATYTVTVTGSNLDKVTTDPILVRDTLPTGATSVSATPSVGTSISCPSGTCEGGEVLTWSIPKAVLTAGSVTLTLSYAVPTDPCLGGSIYNNTATLSNITTTAGCTLTGSSSAGILLINNPGLASVQNFNVATAPSGSFETGSQDNGNAVRDPGEGEFMTFTADYTFGAGYAGNWSGSTYSDNFASLAGQTLVANSLEVQVNGGSFQAVPGGSVTGGTGSLSINLAFLAGASFANSPNVAGVSVTFRYKTVARDSDLNGGTSRGVTQLVSLNLANAGGGACNTSGNIFTQGATYTIARAAASISTSMASSLEICETVPVTLTVNNATAHRATNILATLITSGDYAYPTPQTPTYGGVFNSGNITYAENSGSNPTFTFTGGDLTGAGTITINVRRRTTAGTTPTALSARVDYDDEQTSSTSGTRDFNSTGSSTPAIIRTGSISLNVTPQSLKIIGNTAQWRCYVINGGNGRAFSAVLTNTLPTGLAINQAATDAANPGYPIFTSSGGVITWDLGDIPSATTRIITVVANVTGATCTISLPTQVQASWGCDSANVTPLSRNSPTFTLGSGQMQVVHDTTASVAYLCSIGTNVIVIRNTGESHIYNLSAFEVLNPLTTGLDVIPGSVQYSTNSGTSWLSAGNPSGAGTSGSPYTWTSTQVPALADLFPLADSSGAAEIRIRFTTSSTDATITPPSIQASASGSISCGTAVASPGSPYTVPVFKPTMSASIVGINRTASPGAPGTGTYAATVYAGSGDTIEWRVIISNTGNYVAGNVRMSDTFAGSGAASMYKTNSPLFPSATITSGTVYTLNDIAAASSVTNFFIEVLGSTCVQAANQITVSYGCATPTSGSHSAQVLSPVSATLDMTPNFSVLSQTVVVNGMTNGGVEVTVNFRNIEGTASSLTLSNALPNDFRLDTTFAPVLTLHASAVGQLTNSVTVDNSNPAGPKFVFTGSLRANTGNTTLRYRLYQNASFDTLSDTNNVDETTALGSDPTVPATYNNVVTLFYSTTCATDLTASSTQSINPATPDLDITVSPTNTLSVVSGSTYTLTFDFTIKNNGDANSAATNIIFGLTNIGTGWNTLSAQVLTPGLGGSAGTCLSGPDYNCLQIGMLRTTSNALVRVTGVTKPIAGTPPNPELGLVGYVYGRIKKADGTDTGNNYSLDMAAPTIISDLRILGYLYADTNRNAMRDTAETTKGGGAGTYYAKVWTQADWLASGDAFAAAAVDNTTGAYTFNQITNGSYVVIIDNNNTLTDRTPFDFMTVGWSSTEAPTLIRQAVLVANVDAINQNFGLFQGALITGRVFEDNGLGGGTANNGVLDGTEAGIPGVVVELRNSSNTLVTNTTTDGTGVFRIYNTAGTGAGFRIVEKNPANYISTGGEIGNTAGTYDRVNDRLTFNIVANTSYSGINFGDVKAPTFTTDGQRSGMPGNTVFYPHSFIATTAGTVSFTTVSTPTSGSGAWSQVLFRDSNCDGNLDGGEPIITPASPISVVAGDQICLVIKEVIPVNAPLYSKDQIVVSALFTYTGASPSLTATLTRTDLTTVGAPSTAGLDLSKTVNKTSALPGETITYTVTYLNNSTQPISTLVIFDETPTFTVFTSAAAGPFPANLTNVAIVNPGVGNEGPIRWTFTGTLAPGATGTVTFTVTVQQ
jgi:uncharacterized repeat protein (TIGR01451 family)